MRASVDPASSGLVLAHCEAATPGAGHHYDYSCLLGSTEAELGTRLGPVVANGKDAAALDLDD